MTRPSALHRWWRFLQLTWSPHPPHPPIVGRFAPAPGTRTDTTFKQD